MRSRPPFWSRRKQRTPVAAFAQLLPASCSRLAPAAVVAPAAAAAALCHVRLAPDTLFTCRCYLVAAVSRCCLYICFPVGRRVRLAAGS